MLKIFPIILCWSHVQLFTDPLSGFIHFTQILMQFFGFFESVKSRVGQRLQAWELLFYVTLETNTTVQHIGQWTSDFDRSENKNAHHPPRPLPALDGMLVHRRVTTSVKFACTHWYTWVKRGTVRVKCLAQEHNAVFLARSGVLRTIKRPSLSFCQRETTQK